MLRALPTVITRMGSALCSQSHTTISIIISSSIVTSTTTTITYTRSWIPFLSSSLWEEHPYKQPQINNRWFEDLKQEIELPVTEFENHTLFEQNYLYCPPDEIAMKSVKLKCSVVESVVMFVCVWERERVDLNLLSSVAGESEWLLPAHQLCLSLLHLHPQKHITENRKRNLRKKSKNQKKKKKKCTTNPSQERKRTWGKRRMAPQTHQKKEKERGSEEEI